MWGNIALFEARYQLRRPIAIVSFLVFFALGFGQATVVAMNNSGEIAANTPAGIVFAHSAFSIVAMFLSLAMIADVALRDAATGMDAILRTKPVQRAPYLAARFAGAFAVALLAISGATFGALLATLMPWIPPGAVGPFKAQPYIFGFLAIAAVNVFSTSTLFFLVAALSRSLLATYLGALALFLVFVLSGQLSDDPAYRTLGALSDPFGRGALSAVTRYWTNQERRTLSPPFTNLLIWNRLLWIGLGATMLLAAVTSFDALGGRRRNVKTDLGKIAVSPSSRERPRAVVGGAGLWDQLWMRTRFEVGTALRSWTFLVMLVLAVAACLGTLIAVDQVQSDIHSLPVTYVVIDQVAAAFGLAAVLVPVAYAGELVWRDRSVNIAAIIDATPTPTIVFFVSKIIAMAAAIFFLFAVVAATGMAFQLVRGVHDINPSFYLIKMVVVLGLPSLLFGVLALLIQTILNQKYVALLLVFAIIVAVPFATSVGIEDKLLVLFEVPEVPLSDLNGYGHYLTATLWFALYWICVALLIAVATNLLWVRGTGSLWTRIKQSRQRVGPGVLNLVGVALAGIVTSGGYIYWNTHVLNDFVTTADTERAQLAYEKAYRGEEDLPQPRITSINIEVDLFPGSRAFRSRGEYTLVNQSNSAIEQIHVVVPDEKGAEISLEDADIEKSTSVKHVYDFRPRGPFMPGETRTLTFSLSGANPGIQSGGGDTAIVYNGSFAASSKLAPLIGVQSRYYLQSASRRRAYGLEPLPASAGPENPIQRRRNFLSGDADFIRYGITVSTEADQIALAPGNLEREWTDGGRRFFRYTTDTPIVNFWAVVSARYAVARDTWNGVDLAVYYEPKHVANVARMLDAMKQSLAYYTENFGPFPHRNLRIAEFPRYAPFAQSFPTLIPYSESVGFIADLRDDTRPDFVWHITAHEVAHQWWAHQVVGANADGAQFLSESLSEYSALMVAERRYGPHRMRQFLKRELDTYLRSRGQTKDERPLARAAMNQNYVHYQKGSLALYALRDALGEDVLNRCLARLLREQKYKSDPYPVADDFIEILRSQAGPDHQTLISDLFNKITFWQLSILKSEIKQAPNGNWRVHMDVRASKAYATGNGVETEAPLEQLIDVGLFASNPDQTDLSSEDVLFLEKRLIKSGTQSIEIEVSRKPSFAGIDPYTKLISRDNSLKVVSLGN
jgi:ABC-2 type transport system permease protein